MGWQAMGDFGTFVINPCVELVLKQVAPVRLRQQSSVVKGGSLGLLLTRGCKLTELGSKPSTQPSTKLRDLEPFQSSQWGCLIWSQVPAQTKRSTLVRQQEAV